MLLPTLVAARTWHVPGDAPTIQEGINLALPGDDVLVAPGVYMEHDIVMRPGVWVHCEGGPSVTTVDANGAGVGFLCTDLQQTSTIEGFTILNGWAHTEQLNGSGGGIRCIGSSLTVRDCIITGCSAEFRGGGIYAGQSNVEVDACRIADCASGREGGGINAYASTATITDCEFLGNEAGTSDGGIGAFGPEVSIVRCLVSGNVAIWGGGGGIGCMSPALTIRDCLIIHNSAYDYGEAGGLGIDEYSSGVIEGCTVANNRGIPPPGGIVVSYSSEIEIDRTIIAFNEGVGLRCDAYESDVTLQCCDLYGNTEGDGICDEDIGGNFSADPLFCDAAHGDFTLDAQSPCLPGNHPDGINCGLIGARGQGCGATPVEETTWGRLKILYR
jgi:hypothetical protein